MNYRNNITNRFTVSDNVGTTKRNDLPLRNFRYPRPSTLVTPKKTVGKLSGTPATPPTTVGRLS